MIVVPLSDAVPDTVMLVNEPDDELDDVVDNPVVAVFWILLNIVARSVLDDVAVLVLISL